MKHTQRKRPTRRALLARCAALTVASAATFGASALTHHAAAHSLAAAPPHVQSGKRADSKPSARPTPAPRAAAPLKRTTARQETRRFAYGGRLTVYGAPQGSLIVEAWERAEVEIAAEVELTGDTEEDLARLAAVNTFHLDDDVNHITVLTVGTHDRKYMKRTAKDFPKRLLGQPWKIDYRVRVPVMTDLEIYSGRGALTIKGVEGAVRLIAGESDPTVFTLAGGDVEATLQGGTVSLDVTARSWRGRGASLRLIRGDLNLALPPNFSGYVNAEVLRTGSIENAYAGLVPRERTKPTERTLQGVAGSGGATLSLTVGDGRVRIKSAAAP
ncbi:MAG TPA: hypothetical protein VF240_07960 [Pyrinomonadaceae bacterium]